MYASCFDANAGLFEQLLGPEDAVISDALNHASIIDGIRLCKAKKFRYSHKDMAGKIILYYYKYLRIILYYFLRMPHLKLILMLHRFGAEVTRITRLSNKTNSDRWSIFNGWKFCTIAWNLWSCRQVSMQTMVLGNFSDTYTHTHYIIILFTELNILILKT